MPAVQITGAVWPVITEQPQKLGPYLDSLGNLWVFAFNSTPNVTAFKSSDGGRTWSNTASSITSINHSLDTIYDGNDTVYVFLQDSSHVVHIYSFTLSTATWNAEIFSSGTRPTVVADANAQFPALFVRRSTGEFVCFVQGPLHNSSIRSPYYNRVSSAGVYTAQTVEFTNSVVHASMKGLTIDSSNIVYMVHAQSNGSMGVITLDASNVKGTNTNPQPSNTGAGWTEANMGVDLFVEPTLARVLYALSSGNVGTQWAVYRSALGATVSFTSDTNSVGSARYVPGPPILGYDGANLHAIWIDNTTRDVFHNQTPSTTWTTAAATNLQTATAAAALSGNLVFQSFYYIWQDTNVFFDRLDLVPPPELGMKGLGLQAQQGVKRSAFFCLGDKWARRGRLWLPSADRDYVLA